MEFIDQIFPVSGAGDGNFISQIRPKGERCVYGWRTRTCIHREKHSV